MDASKGCRMSPATQYRAIYLTLWRMNERHDLRHVFPAANDRGPPGPRAA